MRTKVTVSRPKVSSYGTFSMVKGTPAARAREQDVAGAAQRQERLHEAAAVPDRAPSTPRPVQASPLVEARPRSGAAVRGGAGRSPRPWPYGRSTVMTAAPGWREGGVRACGRAGCAGSGGRPGCRAAGGRNRASERRRSPAAASRSSSAGAQGAGEQEEPADAEARAGGGDHQDAQGQLGGPAAQRPLRGDAALQPEAEAVEGPGRGPAHERAEQQPVGDGSGQAPSGAVVVAGEEADRRPRRERSASSRCPRRAGRAGAGRRSAGPRCGCRPGVPSHRRTIAGSGDRQERQYAGRVPEALRLALRRARGSRSR